MPLVWALRASTPDGAGVVPAVSVSVIVDLVGAGVKGLAVGEVSEQFRHAKAKFGEDWVAAAKVSGVGDEEARDDHGSAAEGE
eukprot:5612629-Pleurochrysis_carterae.AAC.1